MKPTMAPPTPRKNYSTKAKQEPFSKDSPDTEHGRESISGSSQPSAIQKKHPVDIQNGIYAAERLPCSLEITHLINFILRGVAHPSKLLIHGNSQHPVFQE